MALSVVNNVSSLTAQTNLNRASSALSKSLERLSSGLKVNRGADGPAALVISEQQRAQITGLRAALDNTNKAVSVVQTGEGALNEINRLLNKVRALALDSANSGVNDANALAANQAEIRNALDTINNIATRTQFGTKKLLDGSAGVTGTTTNATASFVAAAEGTTAGSYAIAVTAAATRANVQAGNPFAAPLAGQGLSINGIAVDLQTTDTTIGQVISKINAVSGETGVLAENNGGGIRLYSSAFGAGNVFTVTGTYATVNANFGAVTDGTDVAGTIGGQAATGQGNVLTVDPGSANGTDGLAVSIAVNQANVTTTLTGGAVTASVAVTNGSLTFQVGANANQTATIGFRNVQATALGINAAQTNGSGFASLNAIDVTSQAGAQDTLAVVDQAINEITTFRGRLGAFQANTLEANANNLRATLENTVAAESVIRDTDFAEEISNFTKNQVLLQAGQTVLGNANQIPQLVAALLQG